MDIDATQVLDLGLEVEEEEEEAAKKQIGKLATFEHRGFPVTEFPIYEGINIIGRDERSNIPIKVQAVSKKHACIEVCGDSFLIYDFNSRNKTRKGKLVLKPHVRYEIVHGDELIFGDIKCCFERLTNQDSDETGSLTDGGSETGSESMIPEDTEGVVEDKHDLRVANDNLQNEEKSDVSESDSILLPTQNHLNNKKKVLSNMIGQGDVNDLYAADTESESEGEVEASHNTPNGKHVQVVNQTPGFGLPELAGLPSPPSVIDETGDNLSCSYKSDDDGDVLQASPPLTNASAIHTSQRSVSTDSDQYASTVPIEDSQEKRTIKDCLEQIADTVVMEKSESVKDVRASEDELPQTYVFEEYDYEGEDEDSFDEDNREVSEKIEEPFHVNMKLLPSEKTPDINSNLECENSQEIPLQKTVAKYITSTQLGSFHSFGTPASSIDNRSLQSCSSAEGKTEVSNKQIVSDSEEEETQPYETSSPYKYKSPEKSDFKIPEVPVSADTALPLNNSLPGGNTCTEFVGVVDKSTHMSSSDDDAPKNKQNLLKGDCMETDGDVFGTSGNLPTQKYDVDNAFIDKEENDKDEENVYTEATQLYPTEGGNDKLQSKELDCGPTQAYCMETDGDNDMETQAYVFDNAEIQSTVNDNTATQAYNHDNIETQAYNHDNIETQAYNHDNIETQAYNHDNIETQAYSDDNMATQAYASLASETEMNLDDGTATQPYSHDCTQVHYNVETQAYKSEETETHNDSLNTTYDFADLATQAYTNDIEGEEQECAATKEEATQRKKEEENTNEQNDVPASSNLNPQTTDVVLKKLFSTRGRRIKKCVKFDVDENEEQKTSKQTRNKKLLQDSSTGKRGARKNSKINDVDVDENVNTRSSRKKGNISSTDKIHNEEIHTKNVEVSNLEMQGHINDEVDNVSLPKRRRGKRSCAESVSHCDEENKKQNSPEIQKEKPVKVTKARAKRKTKSAAEDNVLNGEISNPVSASTCETLHDKIGAPVVSEAEPVKRTRGKRKTKSAPDEFPENNEPIKEGAEAEKSSCKSVKRKIAKKKQEISENNGETQKSVGVKPTVSTPRRLSNAIKPKIVFTGISNKSVEKIVIDLGGYVVDSVDKATHLVTDKVRRTVKFLCAVAKGLPIVTPAWLKASKVGNTFTAYKSYLLQDKAAEKQYKFQLQQSIEKAADSAILSGRRIYVTKNVKPEPASMKEMIECSGGKSISKVPRSVSDDIIIISCDEDQEECEIFIDQGFNVCSNELLLTGILRQEIDLKLFSLHAVNCSQSNPTEKKRKGRPGSTATPSKRRR